MKYVFYLISILYLMTACKKPYTCECVGSKDVVEMSEDNGVMFSDTITKTIFDSEVFNEKNENDAYATCSNKKNVIISDLTDSQTSVIVECSLK